MSWLFPSDDLFNAGMPEHGADWNNMPAGLVNFIRPRRTIYRPLTSWVRILAYFGITFGPQ